MERSPIPTIYKGARFPSKLKMKYAVAFDSLYLPWSYVHRKGDPLCGVGYRPDYAVRAPTGAVHWYDIRHESVASDPDAKRFEQRLWDERDAEWRPLFCRNLVDNIELRPYPQVYSMLSGDPKHVVNATLNIDPNAVRVCPRCGLFAVPLYGFAVDGNRVLFGCESCDLQTYNNKAGPEQTFLLVPVASYKRQLIIDVDDYNRWNLLVQRVCHAARFYQVYAPSKKSNPATTPSGLFL